MIKKYILVFLIVLMPHLSFADTYLLIEGAGKISYKFESTQLSDAIMIESRCELNKPIIYSAFVIDRATNMAKVGGMPSAHLVRLWLDGGYSGQHIDFGDERLFLHKIRKLQASNIQDNERNNTNVRINVYASDLLKLPTLCGERLEKIANEKANKSRAVAKSTGLSPMFSGNNLIEARDLTVMYIRSSSQLVDKYVWLGDSDYRVSKVSEKGVMFKPRLGGAYYIAILSKFNVTLGQKISDATTGPLKFIGIEDYTTDLGTRTKVFIFEPVLP